MSERFEAPRRRTLGPALIIVNGSPAAGLATIASVLASRLGLPLFTREAEEAALLEAESPLMRDSEATRRRVGAAATAAVFQHLAEPLAHGRAVAIAGPFLPRRDDAQLERLRRRTPCRPLQVLVTAALPVLVRRVEEQAVYQGNVVPRDPAELQDLERRLREESRALEVHPTIRVDTTSYDSVDLDALEDRVCAWVEGGEA